MNKRLTAVLLVLLSLTLVSCTAPTEDPDQQVLTQLEDAGSDLSKPHDLEFFLYFRDELAAEAAAEDVRALGFSVEVRPAAVGTDWL